MGHLRLTHPPRNTRRRVVSRVVSKDCLPARHLSHRPRINHSYLQLGQLAPAFPGLLQSSQRKLVQRTLGGMLSMTFHFDGRPILFHLLPLALDSLEHRSRPLQHGATKAEEGKEPVGNYLPLLPKTISFYTKRQKARGRTDSSRWDFNIYTVRTFG